jgi:peptidoglycan/xylan/chitin deacetylase (PgdA/CDA1 family)
MGVLGRGLFFRGAGLKSSRSLSVLAVATLYVACTDPPNLGDDGTAGGAGKTGGTAGAGAKGGSSTGGSNTGGSGATSGSASGGKGGSGASSGKGTGGKGGGTTGGTGGGATGGTDQMGEGGMSAGMAGEGGASGGMAGEGGMGAASGEGGAGAEAGAGAVDQVCAKAAGSVGGKSLMAALPTTGVVQPSGTPGNMKVLNWAGFKGALSWTFDDNLASMLAHYPDLNAVGVPLTFYLVCSTEGSNQVWHDAVAAGHELGNHTMHHCNSDGNGCAFGNAVGTQDPNNEIDQCTTQLMSEYGLGGVYSMAAPNGDSGWDALASTRFLVNRGVSSSGGVLPNSNSDPFNLQCHISNGPDNGVPDATNSQLAAGTGGFNEITDATAASGKWDTILIHGFGPNDYGYHEVQISEAVLALQHSKDQRDAGNVWVDTVTAIGAYWRAQKVVSAVTPVTSGSDITYSWTLPAHFPPNMYLRVTVDGGTLTQCGTALTWNDHGYYEVALDAGSVTISP